MKTEQNNECYKSLTNQIVGDYILKEYIGNGKIGFVYRAERKDIPSSVWAVKLVFDNLKKGWENEINKVVLLTLVEGVVHFHGLGTCLVKIQDEPRMTQYTVWDYIPPGRNLKTYIEQNKTISTSFLIAVVDRILYVLQMCHDKGVSRHGDLHSGNILIGDENIGNLDDSLHRRAPIYVSDFGYGATGATKDPKDDYIGLVQIINEMVPKIDYSTATTTDRQILNAVQHDLGKLLNERNGSEYHSPIELLRILRSIKQNAQSGNYSVKGSYVNGVKQTENTNCLSNSTVGQFQVSEMIGDRWDWWKALFVPTFPARSKILALDMSTVVTGPRGCGKTMLFRRLSERLVVECGDVEGITTNNSFLALYVNANDFADAFAHYKEKPNNYEESKLICFANLCILSDLLSVQSSRIGRFGEVVSPKLLSIVQNWLLSSQNVHLLEGEDPLEQYRTLLEQIKWKFTTDRNVKFPGYSDLSKTKWLPYFIKLINNCCSWIGQRTVMLFIDDFSTPRVSTSMQRSLNRLFFQRSPDFLTKVATEAPSTFVSEDSSGKILQDGDDYQLVDIGEESLFLSESERLSFLEEVFSKRLSVDNRIPNMKQSLRNLLGRNKISKTEFARRLRGIGTLNSSEDKIEVTGNSKRRGRTRARVQYYGDNVFSDLWSGDTRTMIQLITDVVDQAAEISKKDKVKNIVDLPIKPETQDLVFRNRGGEWLNSHTRNEPTDPIYVNMELKRIQENSPDYNLCGDYGYHLKAVVEAFVTAARNLLLGPPYIINENGKERIVPRMAFRIEIIDEFRIDGLAKEIYRDLIRYGLFMRDNRGKSIRGTFVPRLYLRRLLIPYCALALSKRDSVQLSCKSFIQLLLYPDLFKSKLSTRRSGLSLHINQLEMPFDPTDNQTNIDPAYDDLTDGQ